MTAPRFVQMPGGRYVNPAAVASFAPSGGGSTSIGLVSGHGFTVGAPVAEVAAALTVDADTVALDAIWRQMDGEEWNGDTLESIAEIIRGTGRPAFAPPEVDR